MFSYEKSRDCGHWKGPQTVQSVLSCSELAYNLIPATIPSVSIFVAGHSIKCISRVVLCISAVYMSYRCRSHVCPPMYPGEYLGVCNCIYIVCLCVFQSLCVCVFLCLFWHTHIHVCVCFSGCLILFISLDLSLCKSLWSLSGHRVCVCMLFSQCKCLSVYTVLGISAFVEHFKSIDFGSVSLTGFEATESLPRLYFFIDIQPSRSYVVP